MDDARRVLEQALVIAREHGHKRAEGQVLGYLGLVHARRGDFAAARTCLDAGESLLRAASDPESLGILLALRAEAEQLAGSAGDARSALAAAEEIAAAVSPAANSEFGNALTRARGSLAD